MKNYKSSTWDELIAKDGQAHPAAQELVRYFAALSPKELEERREAAERAAVSPYRY